MHKLYKENYLYHKKSEDINYISCEAYHERVHFQTRDGYGYIDCDDCNTAQIVFKDICDRYSNNKNFVKTKYCLINISKVLEIKLDNDDDLGFPYVDILYKDGYTNTICDRNDHDIKMIYEYLIERLNEFKAQDENIASTNCF